MPAPVSAIHGAPNQPHYATAKTAILGLVRSMAVALARHQIRVNALLPGWTDTDLQCRRAFLHCDERGRRRRHHQLSVAP